MPFCNYWLFACLLVCLFHVVITPWTRTDPTISIVSAKPGRERRCNYLLQTHAFFSSSSSCWMDGWMDVSLKMCFAFTEKQVPVFYWASNKRAKRTNKIRFATCSVRRLCIKCAFIGHKFHFHECGITRGWVERIRYHELSWLVVHKSNCMHRCRTCGQFNWIKTTSPLFQWYVQFYLLDNV